MQLKIFIFLLINSLSFSFIFPSQPYDIPLDKIYIRTIYDENSGTLRLRWDDDFHQFLTFHYLQFNFEESQQLTQQHFQEIRIQMQQRIERHMNLLGSPLHDTLSSKAHAIASQLPLPSIEQMHCLPLPISPAPTPIPPAIEIPDVIPPMATNIPYKGVLRHMIGKYKNIIDCSHKCAPLS